MRRSALAGAAAVLPNWQGLRSTLYALTGGMAVTGDVRNGEIGLKADQLEVGSTIDLTGQWLFKPDYAIGANERPERGSADGYVPVDVPQFLNRIRWWLDDSEDFDRRESERLDRLGFDVDRADDGWYRLRIDNPGLPDGRRLFLHFDGVAMISRVYLNGQELGDHAGMFSRFGFDLTPHLQSGPNDLAVYVSMEKIPPSSLDLGEAVTVNLTASKVLSMSKGMFGPLSPNADNRAYDLYGIWQPVRLSVRGEAMIDDAWFVPSLDGAEVQIEARGLDGAGEAVLEATWTDRSTGQRFASTAPQRIRLENDSTTTTLRISDLSPKHWTPADPHLYTMEVALKDTRGNLLDRYTHDVGFRTFEIQGNRFFLNGHPYWLRGSNHLPYGKNPWDPELPRKLVQLMHDGNQRVTRTHCTPWNETWLNASDEIGLGVSIEGIRPWALVGNIGGPPPEIFQHWLMEHEDVIRRCRNHPSVLIWTIGNEMMLRDPRNLEKWKLLSTVVKRTRELDPTRPIVCSSDYTRDPEYHAEVLEPNGIDDGDIDDIHRYYGWYGTSNFVQDSWFEEEMTENQGLRPFIGQEMSTGYPDLDTGLPVLRYTRDLLTPQAWVGNYAYPGNDPAIWLDHHRAVTKRWAEQLRYRRTGRTAGFMLFATECWFRHSYDPSDLQPYPVYHGAALAWAPVGLALRTARRRFYAGEAVETAVFATNDDERFADYSDLSLVVEYRDRNKRLIQEPTHLGRIDRLPYYEVAELPVRFELPAVDGPRQQLTMVLRLLHGDREVGRTEDSIEVFRAFETPAEPAPHAVFASAGPELERFIAANGLFARTTRGADDAPDRGAVVLVGPGAAPDLLSPGSWLRQWMAAGGTAIAFSPAARIQEQFPEEIDLVRNQIGEYGDTSPIVGTPLARGLEPMDLKWWGRRGEERTFIASQHHRLADTARGRSLVRFIPSHGYVNESTVPGLLRSVVSEIPVGAGRLWICDLDLEASVGVDPAADLFARNLLLAAADATSTDHLVSVPSHQHLLETTHAE